MNTKTTLIPGDENTLPTVRLWSAHEQRWIVTADPSDRDLAALPEDEREAAIAHTRGNSERLAQMA